MTGPARPRGEKGEKGGIWPKGMPGATGGPGKMGETGPENSGGEKKDMRESRPKSMPGFIGGSVAEWSARRTRNPAVPGSSPALATCCICAWSSRVQVLDYACK